MLLRPLYFVSVLETRLRHRIKKKLVFSVQRTHFIATNYKKKVGAKKNIPKKICLFQEMKNIFPAMTCFDCFFVAFNNVKKVKSAFYFVALITFSKNSSNVFLCRYCMQVLLFAFARVCETIDESYVTCKVIVIIIRGQK